MPASQGNYFQPLHFKTKLFYFLKEFLLFHVLHSDIKLK